MEDNNEKTKMNETIGDEGLQTNMEKEEELPYQGDTDGHFAEPGDCD